MRKQTKSSLGKGKTARPAKRRQAWSLERAAFLRRQVAMPSGGDCNCGGK